MSAQLTPLSGGPFSPIPLQRPVVLIGRHPECDVRLDLSKISRRHCCVALAYDRVMIRDLGSRNGLRVNGRVVDEAQLLPGDELAIGPLLYRVDVLSPPPPATNSKPPVAALPELPGLPSDSDDLVALDF
jgi:pSer/pThr/pTyr-binding forkhead associated (FHA) protein